MPLCDCADGQTRLARRHAPVAVASSRVGGCPRRAHARIDCRAASTANRTRRRHGSWAATAGWTILFLRPPPSHLPPGAADPPIGRPHRSFRRRRRRHRRPNGVKSPKFRRTGTTRISDRKNKTICRIERPGATASSRIIIITRALLRCIHVVDARARNRFFVATIIIVALCEKKGLYRTRSKVNNPYAVCCRKSRIVIIVTRTTC